MSPNPSRRSLKKAAVTLAATFISLALPGGALGLQDKFALVIGNMEYAYYPVLRNPTNDAVDMATVLDKLGFEVTTGLNLTQEEMNRTLQEFHDRLTDESIALLYYSGHGSEMGGINYLFPVDFSTVARSTDLSETAISVGDALGRMAKARIRIVILDTCRNSPFKGSHSPARGLTAIHPTTGTFIAYATAPGDIAVDGQGRNSPYTKHLLENLKIPGLEIEDLFKRVCESVMVESRSRQVPWYSSSIAGTFCLNTLSRCLSEPPGRPYLPSAETTYQEVGRLITSYRTNWTPISKWRSEWQRYLRKVTVYVKFTRRRGSDAAEVIRRLMLLTRIIHDRG